LTQIVKNKTVVEKGFMRIPILIFFFLFVANLMLKIKYFKWRNKTKEIPHTTFDFENVKQK
jgi:hypothetical protein